MVTKHPKLFYTLERILNRINLSEANPPANLEEWHNFVAHINNSFYDFEQERYLLERSMAISSQEMLDLNEREILRHEITKVLAEKFSFNETAPELLKIICETLNLDLGSYGS